MSHEAFRRKAIRETEVFLNQELGFETSRKQARPAPRRAWKLVAVMIAELLFFVAYFSLPVSGLVA